MIAPMPTFVGSTFVGFTNVPARREIGVGSKKCARPEMAAFFLGVGSKEGRLAHVATQKARRGAVAPSDPSATKERGRLRMTGHKGVV
jgi:hypothetical protein